MAALFVWAGDSPRHGLASAAGRHSTRAQPLAENATKAQEILGQSAPEKTPAKK